jgi:antitoxin ParD1/3/4
MAIEQMNISMSPQMARFIRDKVRSGQYSNISEVVRDAVRRMQEMDAQRERGWWADFEAGLTSNQREGIRHAVRQGITDIEEGRYRDYDGDRTKGLARELVGASRRKLARRQKEK